MHTLSKAKNIKQHQATYLSEHHEEICRILLIQKAAHNQTQCTAHVRDEHGRDTHAVDFPALLALQPVEAAREEQSGDEEREVGEHGEDAGAAQVEAQDVGQVRRHL